MPLPAKIASLFRSLFRKARLDRELDAELRSYLDMLTEEKIKAGLSPEQARRQARIELGGMEQVKMKVREVRFGTTLETVWQDLRYGARMLARNPGFTTVAVLTLALGIGANTAIFSVLNSMVLQPLPYHDSHQLLRIYSKHEKRGWNHVNASYPDFLDFKKNAKTLSGLVAFTRFGMNFSAGEEAVRLRAGRTTSGFFEVLGLNPILGRTIRPEDQELSDERVVLVDEEVWRRRFAGANDVLGKQAILNGRSYTIIGVVPTIPQLAQV